MATDNATILAADHQRAAEARELASRPRAAWTEEI